MKWVLIGLFVVGATMDILLILGSAKLERMREKNERNNRKV